MTLRPLLLLALLVMGCGRSELDPRPEEDADRARDGGTRDGGRPDSGVPDGGNRDGGTADAGTPDGGTPDGGCVEGWRPTGALPWAAGSPKAVALPDGRVLVAGGGRSAEDTALHDPSTGRFTRTGPMHSTRGYGSTATTLLDGRVLLAGGTGGSPYPYPELYDPATGQFTFTGRLPSVRYNHAMVRLADGRVLLSGGNDGTTTTAAAFLWNPASGLWTPTDPMPGARENLTLTLLPDGAVLATGGFARSPNGGGRVPTTDAWRYDPAMGHWSTTGSLHQARELHRAVRLASGDVLVVGGTGLFVPGTENTTDRAEVYDWRTGVFTEISPMRFRRVGHQTALLPSGEVLVAGGRDGTPGGPDAEEIYSPVTGTWRLVPRLLEPRSYPGLVVLPNGTVLAAGGYEIFTAGGLSSAEIFTPCPAP